MKRDASRKRKKGGIVGVSIVKKTGGSSPVTCARRHVGKKLIKGEVPWGQSAETIKEQSITEKKETGRC